MPFSRISAKISSFNVVQISVLCCRISWSSVHPSNHNCSLPIAILVSKTVQGIPLKSLLVHHYSSNKILEYFEMYGWFARHLWCSYLKIIQVLQSNISFRSCEIIKDNINSHKAVPSYDLQSFPIFWEIWNVIKRKNIHAVIQNFQFLELKRTENAQSLWTRGMPWW